MVAEITEHEPAWGFYMINRGQLDGIRASHEYGVRKKDGYTHPGQPQDRSPPPPGRRRRTRAGHAKRRRAHPADTGIFSSISPNSNERHSQVSNRLKQIIDHKREEIQKIIPLGRKAAGSGTHSQRFPVPRNALSTRAPISSHSLPRSKRRPHLPGVIAEDFDPLSQAQIYDQAGANAISVLTDEKFFQGSLSYLTKIRENVSVPVLRKDFIIHRRPDL